MLFERHNLSLSVSASTRPSQSAIPCHAAGRAPGGQTHFASLGRLATGLIVAFCALFCAAASAQTVNFAGAMLPLSITGLSTPTYTAMDAQGNLYITDCANSRVLKETPGANGSYFQSVVADANNPGLVTPEGIAVDQYGIVYITDISTQRVTAMVPQGGGTYAAAAITTYSSLNAPYGIAVDKNGNLYISDALNDVVLKETPGPTAYSETTVASTANASNMQEPMGIAVDAQGYVYIADYGSNSLIIMSPPSGGVYAEDTYYGVSSGLSAPTSVAVDVNYNVFVGNSGNNNVLEFNGSVIQVAAEILNNPMGVAVDANDNLYIADTVNDRIVKDSLKGWNFGQVPVGTQSPEIAMLFDINAAGTLSLPIVVTQGAMGEEFSDPGNGSCSPISYIADSDCTVGVTFTPAYAGSRYGAADVTAAGYTLATGYMQGYGIGAQVNFLPPTQNTPIIGVPTMGIAVDSVGNVYATDTNQLALIPPGGSAAQATVIIQGLSDGAGVAVDGNGNVYFADAGANEVGVSIPQPSGGYITNLLPTSALSSPVGVAVDAWGNVYIVDSTNNRVLKETLSAGNYSESIVANAASNGLLYPEGVAVDGGGNVFISDTANYRVLEETPSASGYIQSIVPTTTALGRPFLIAVDGNDNLYIAYYDTNQVVKETLSGGSYMQSTVPTTGLYQPLAVAVDPRGNVYVADTGNGRIVEEDFSDAPTLNFATTVLGKTSTDSPQTVTVVNTGNLGMALETVNYPFDFPEAGGVTTDCATDTPLNVYQSCTLTIDFTPTPVSLNGNPSASLSESVILQDNLFNPLGVDIRKITVNGTVTAPPAPTITLSPAALPAGTVGAAYSQQFTAGGGTAPYTFEQVGGYLPSGMTLSSSGVLSGIPTSGGTFSISVNAIDSSSSPGPYNGSASYSLTIAAPTITLSPTSLPAGTVGAAYSQAISASGGTAPYTFSLTYGTLPAGVTLNSNGTLSGTPTASGTYPITVNAVDSSTGTGPYATSQIFPLIVGLEPIAPAPTFSVPDGVYTSAQTVTLSDAISGAAIYYTTDGTTPTIGSTPYGSGSISVNSSETIQAIAVATGYANSGVSAAAYAINLAGTPVAATPTFSVATGTYTSAQTVNISESTGGAVIYYTTDGTMPSTGSTKYSTTITVQATEVLQAIAVAAGYNNSEVASAAYAINLPGTPVAATPAFSVGTGSYSVAQTVNLSDSTNGAAIYYTTDGTAPTITSAKFSGAITVSSTETIQAIAIATGYSNSAIAAAAYAMNLPGTPIAATPTFSVASGNYASAQTVTISDATGGVAIYYTTDGSTPTSSSAKYGGSAINVSSSETIQAIAIATGYSNSAIASAAYAINLPGTAVVATPTFSVATGSYTTVQTVKISDTTAGATIYYTTDGTTPTASSNLAEGPITVSFTETIQAIAVASGYSNSAIGAAAYAINPPGTPVAVTPTFSVASGNYTSTQTVSISDSTSEAAIYFTTDGTTPTANSTLYSSAITVSSTETLQAVAVAGGYSNSAIASVAYTINLSQAQVAAPHFSIGTGTFTSAQTVTLTDATAGAAIYYTTDGSTPTANSNLAGGPITVASTETITAIAITAGDSNSEVVWATYTINPAAPDFILSASNSSATMLQGSPAVFNLTVTPLNATGFSTGLTLAVTGLPTGATAVFSPASIASGAGTTPVTMTIQAPKTSASTQPDSSIVGKLAPFSLALLLLPFAGMLRKSGKRFGRMFAVLLLLCAGAAAMAGLSGCGSSNGIFGLMPKAYTVTVTGTMGSVSHSTTTILIVQ